MLSSSASIDPYIFEWIIEFLARQRFDIRTLSKLISVFPISTASLFLKKTLILMKIELEVTDNSISEKILDYFELLIDLDRHDSVSDFMKSAYCAVSVVSTLGFLEVGRHEYSSAVMRIWIDRVSSLGVNGMKGLISRNLMNWKRVIESSLWDEIFREVVVKNGSDVDATQLVKAFLEDAWRNLGPPFLEMVVDDAVLSGSYGQDLNLHQQPENMPVGSVGETFISTDCNQILGMSCEFTLKAVQDIESRRHTSVQNRGPFGAAASNSGIFMHYDTSIDSENHINLSSPVVHGILGTLRSSFFYLQKSVVDPLPEALHFSETLMHEMEIKNISAKMKNSTAHVVQANGDNFKSMPASISQSNKDKGLDKATHINLSDESSNGSGGRFHLSSFRRSKRFHLPSPRRIKTSPLKAKELVKCARRKIKRWSTLEEDTLRVAVRKYGKGNWKQILDENADIFEERNVVDLKDKWRNICKE